MSPSAQELLGEVRSTHRPSNGAIWFLAVLGYAAGGLSLVAACFSRPLDAADLVALVVVVTLGFGGGAAITWVQRASRDDQVQVRERGLSVRTLARKQDIPWSSIDAFTVDAERAITLWLDDGSHVRLAPLSDHEALSAAVGDAVVRQQLEGKLAILRRGHRLPFGALWVEPDGLRHDDRPLPWTDLRDLAVVDHRVVVTAMDGSSWCEVPLAKISSAPLLVAVVEARLRAALLESLE